MNFYKHHIGDYDQATRHLSFVEDAAYSRLIRKYYAEEKPLPADVKQVQRLVGARARDEKEAVETVLGEFFVLEADGWHNKRCDEELGKANKQAETNRQIALEREAKRRARMQNEQSTNRDQKQHESCETKEHESFASREPSQTPDTRHQTPDSRKEKTKRVTALSCSDLMADGLSEETANEWLAFRRQKRAPLTASAWEGIKREASKAGWVMQDVVTKCMARGWQGFEAEWVASGATNGRQHGIDRHGNFGNQDYRAGVGADGSF